MSRFVGPDKRWWAEAVTVTVVYLAYGRLRGLVEGSEAAARAHAHTMIDLERHLGLLVERSVQQAVLSPVWLIQTFDVYYGLVHFIGPGVTLVALWFWFRDRYTYARNVLAVLLVLGLLGFWFYPLMPPRFVDGLGVIDTAARFGPWAEDPDKAANLYAAMPSLHVGWSSWVVFAWWPLVRRWWARVALVAYPVVTLVAVMATGNHYWIDGAGGLAALGIAVVVVRAYRSLRRSGTLVPSAGG